MFFVGFACSSAWLLRWKAPLFTSVRQCLKTTCQECKYLIPTQKCSHCQTQKIINGACPFVFRKPMDTWWVKWSWNRTLMCSLNLLRNCSFFLLIALSFSAALYSSVLISIASFSVCLFLYICKQKINYKSRSLKCFANSARRKLRWNKHPLKFFNWHPHSRFSFCFKFGFNTSPLILRILQLFLKHNMAKRELVGAF